MIKLKYVQLVLIISLLLAFATDLYLSISDLDGHFLANTSATWIKYSEPINLGTKSTSEQTVSFRKRIIVSSAISDLTLKMRAFRNASVWIDGKLVHDEDRSSGEWNKDRIISVPQMPPAEHTITVSVRNTGGPPALMISSDMKDFETDEKWEASLDRNSWSPAVSSENIATPPISREFPDVLTAFKSKFMIYSLFFLPVILLCFLIRSERYGRYFDRGLTTAGAFRILLLIAYAVMAINNFIKMPIFIGMDIHGHIDYIIYIAQFGRLPLPTEGWSMFEPPLFYTLSALLYNVVTYLFSVEFAFKTMRLIPLVCGLLQIEIIYRTMKIVYPQRQDLQAIGTMTGAFIPANICLSQFVGTEPLAACLTSAFVLFVFKMLNTDIDEHKYRYYACMGLLVGFSLLAKISVIVIVPIAALFIALKYFYEKKADIQVFKALSTRLALVFGLAALVAGWYFVRNYINLGHFVVLVSRGGDVIGGNIWWQDPGYRTYSQLMFSLNAMFYPIYSGLTSIWNSLYTTFWSDGLLSGHIAFLYAPPWNYEFMIGGLIFSLVPFMTILAGIFVMFGNRKDSEKLSITFSSICVLTFLLAIFHQYLSLPIYSMAKGKYMLGILPCFAVLAASGYDLITKKAPVILKPLLVSLMVCWAVSVYAGFFVVTVPDKLRELDGVQFADYLKSKGYQYAAVKQLVKAKQTFNSSLINANELVRMIHEMAMIHVRDGEYDEALKYLHLLNEMMPDNATVLYNIACMYSKLNNVTESAKWLRMSINKGYGNKELIRSDPDLENLRRSELYDESMRSSVGGGN